MVLGHRKNSSATSTQPTVDGGHDAEDGDETVVSSEQGNVLTHIISQLRPGADLSRVTLPTFILEPRSMLERITNFMAHPESLLSLPDIDDPVERFVAVTKFYLSGWHIRPPGVKKPLNPILGETYTGFWDYADGTRGYYISEQTSHHPPMSSYFFMAPEHHIRIDGTLKPRSKFLGNSVGSFMEGLAVMRFLNRNERYFITQPNMYARGILFGKMKYELGDHAFVRCPETGLEADIDFKVKGWVGGTYNSIGGFIKDSKTGKNLYELSGFWHEAMYAKDLSTGKKTLLFDAAHSKASFPKSRPLEEQGPRESQRLWDSTTKAIKRADQKTATDDKSRIEDEQRKEASERGEGHVWQPFLFRPAPDGDEKDLDWVINAEVDSAAPAAKQVEQILAITPILPGQGAGPGKPNAAASSTSPSLSQQQQQPSSTQSSQQPEPHPQPTSSSAAASSASPTSPPSSTTQSSSSPSASAGVYQPARPRAVGDVLDGHIDLPPVVETGSLPTTSAIASASSPAHATRPGDPVRRMDSMGNVEIFEDAEG